MRGASCLRATRALYALHAPTLHVPAFAPPFVPSSFPPSRPGSSRPRALHSGPPHRSNTHDTSRRGAASLADTDRDKQTQTQTQTQTQQQQPAPTRRPTPRGYTTQRDIDRSGRSRPPWDHEITDPLIMVIDGGEAEGPLSTRYVLSRLEPGESLRMIQPYIPAPAPPPVPPAASVPGENVPADNIDQNDSSSSSSSSSSSGNSSSATSTASETQDPISEPPPPQPTYAVCKIVNKRDEYERQRQLKDRKRAAAAQKPKTKELEMTWAIGGNDLLVKMSRLRDFLDKGMKVEVTLGRKKGGRRVAEEEAAGVLRRVREEMEASGAREGKPATGLVGGTMRLYLEGVVRK